MKNWTNGGTSRIHVLAKLRRTAPLEKEVEALKTENIVLRTELQNKQGVVGRLEILVRERSNRVDQLTEIIDRL